MTAAAVWFGFAGVMLIALGAVVVGGVRWVQGAE